MKLDIDYDDDAVVIKEVYNGAYIETAEGNRVAFCMRDDTLELNVIPKDGGSKWFRIDMQNLTIEPM